MMKDRNHMFQEYHAFVSLIVGAYTTSLQIPHLRSTRARHFAYEIVNLILWTSFELPPFPSNATYWIQTRQHDRWESSFYYRPYLQGKTSQVILNMVVTNNVNMNVTWMFSWRMRMRAKSPGLSPWAKCPSQDWLLLHPPGISEARSDLKITREN